MLSPSMTLLAHKPCRAVVPSPLTTADTNSPPTRTSRFRVLHPRSTPHALNPSMLVKSSPSTEAPLPLLVSEGSMAKLSPLAMVAAASEVVAAVLPMDRNATLTLKRLMCARVSPPQLHHHHLLMCVTPVNHHSSPSNTLVAISSPTVSSRAVKPRPLSAVVSQP